MAEKQHWRELIGEMADYVIRENCFGDAENFLQYYFSRKNGWKPCAMFLLRLMQKCHADQAAKISYLWDEFLPGECPERVLRILGKTEEAMYVEHRSLWGVRKCMIRTACQTKEGRAFLRTQHLG